MKLRAIRYTLLGLALFTVTISLSAQPPAAHEETELGGKMDGMNAAFRKLRRQISDAEKNGDSLKLVAEIRQGVQEAVELTPAKAADIPEADRGAFVAAYRAKMKNFAAKLDELEAALKAGNNEDAAKIFAALGALQKEGHKEFRKQQERR